MFVAVQMKQLFEVLFTALSPNKKYIEYSLLGIFEKTSISRAYREYRVYSL